MKRFILSTLLVTGACFAFSVQSSKDSSTEQSIKIYTKITCSRTYPSGTYTGQKCITGGTQYCLEYNPDCKEEIRP